MKKLLLAIGLVAFLCVNAQAEPFVVCSPQSDADGYVYTLDGGAAVEVPYTTFVASDGQTYAKILDVGSVAIGNHNMQIKSFKVYEEWGRKESDPVPFAFENPSLGAPQTIRLKK